MPGQSMQNRNVREVVPLMVFQVPNTPDPNEVGRWLDTLFSRYPELPVDSVAHVFGEHHTAFRPISGTLY
jgi:hypothetical protein